MSFIVFKFFNYYQEVEDWMREWGKIDFFFFFHIIKVMMLVLFVGSVTEGYFQLDPRVEVW